MFLLQKHSHATCYCGYMCLNKKVWTFPYYKVKNKNDSGPDKLAKKELAGQGRSIYKILLCNWKGKEKDRPRQGYVFFAFQHEINLSTTTNTETYRGERLKGTLKSENSSLYTTAWNVRSKLLNRQYLHLWMKKEYFPPPTSNLHPVEINIYVLKCV